MNEANFEFKIFFYFTSGTDYLSCILRNFWSSRHFNFVLDSSVTDESFVDKTCVWRKYKILILVFMMSLFYVVFVTQAILHFRFVKGIILSLQLVYDFTDWTHNHIFFLCRNAIDVTCISEITYRSDKPEIRMGFCVAQF